jgi:hypothetical protein
VYELRKCYYDGNFQVARADPSLIANDQDASAQRSRVSLFERA